MAGNYWQEVKIIKPYPWKTGATEGTYDAAGKT
jgi:hypothetical protein